MVIYSIEDIVLGVRGSLFFLYSSTCDYNYCSCIDRIRLQYMHYQNSRRYRTIIVDSNVSSNILVDIYSVRSEMGAFI